jgi:hypothetical protein
VVEIPSVCVLETDTVWVLLEEVWLSVVPLLVMPLVLSVGGETLLVPGAEVSETLVLETVDRSVVVPGVVLPVDPDSVVDVEEIDSVLGVESEGWLVVDELVESVPDDVEPEIESDALVAEVWLAETVDDETDEVLVAEVAVE